MKRLLAILRRLLVYGIVGAVGFLVGMLTLVVVFLRQGPPLQPWHLHRMAGEFTAAQAAEIRTLDDYRQLEDQLAAEVEAAVYPNVGTGPEFALARYSQGSAADPRSRDPDWNRTFELIPANAQRGALLLHGMSDSPYSLRAIGERLHAQGYHVVGLRLPGHGTVPAGLATARWQDMAAAVRLAMRHLRTALGDAPIHVVGYSNGAALAVNHCLDTLDGDADAVPAASLVLISPAISVAGVAAFAKWLGLLAGIPGLQKLAWTDVLPEYDPYKYGSFAVFAGQQVYELTSSISARVVARSKGEPIAGFPPTIAFLSTIDATVSAEAVVDNLLEHLAAGEHELVLFDINRSIVTSSILVQDPGPLTTRMLDDPALPFALTLISNESRESREVVARRKAARSTTISTTALGVSWPVGVLSLSHVALPFSPDDPLYGATRPADRQQLYLGHIFVQGERGLLRLPADAQLRLRHNPFFSVLEQRMLDWMAQAERRR